MEAQERNFTTWPILGVYVWPNPWPYATTYEGEVNTLKAWVHNRLAWLDSNMPGTCETTNAVDYTEARTEISLYPNPVADVLHIQFETFTKSQISISIINQQGSVLLSTAAESRPAGSWTETLDIAAFKPGVYVLRLSAEGKYFTSRFVKGM